MSKQQGSPASKPVASVSSNFSLPNLCRAQPLFVLIVIAQLLVLVHTLLLAPLSVFDWEQFAKASFYVLWNVLLCAAVLCVLRPVIQRQPFTLGAVLAYGLILLVSLGFNAITQLLAHHYLRSAPSAFQWDWQASIAATLVVAVLGGIALRYMYLQQQVQEQAQARLQAQIQALQSRIRPHFLFNSMNIVASLIGSDPVRAERVIEDISELFRASLRAGDQLVTLGDELELGRNYLRIEQLRLGDRLQVSWQVDERLLPVKMPSLTLQPLLENAVYHGIQPRLDGGTVEISGTLEAGRLRIQIVNPLPEDSSASDEQLPRGNRMALANTLARLQAHFGQDAEIKTFRDEHRFFVELGYSVKK